MQRKPDSEDKFINNDHRVVRRTYVLQGIISTMQVCTGHKQVGIDHRGSRPLAVCICKDLGMDCSFEVTGTTDNEVIEKIY